MQTHTENTLDAIGHLHRQAALTSHVDAGELRFTRALLRQKGFASA